MFGVLQIIYLFVEESFSINGVEIDLRTTAGKVTFTIGYLAYLAFLYVVYLLRQTAYLFLRRKIFDERVITNLYRVGVLLLVISVSIQLSLLVYTVLEKRMTQLNLQLFPAFFNIAIGFFFLIVSQILKITQKLKQENDLTI